MKQTTHKFFQWVLTGPHETDIDKNINIASMKKFQDL